MTKTFAIIGSGWRARFYLRIAASDSNDLSVCGVLCRTKEKAEAIEKDFGVFTTFSEQDIIDKEPDFIVVSVNKASIYAVSKHWRELGFTVLCETPVGLTDEELQSVLKFDGKPLLVAEQYQYYPTYKKMIELAESGRLGEINSADVSAAHEYHGISLIRNILGEKPEASYRMLVTKYNFPVTKTGDRYFVYNDGEIINKPRVKAFIEFEDGKIATYDFDSEQYHSLIRHNNIKITGTRGELINEKIWYLDENNNGHEELLFSDIMSVRSEGVPEGILSEDELAIQELLEKTYLVSQIASGVNLPDKAFILAWACENLKGAVADAYFMNLLSASEGSWVTFDGKELKG